MPPTSLNSAALASIAALLEGYEEGNSLDAPFYASREVYDFDMEAVFGRHWLFCATEAELADEGDYVTLSMGKYSIIIIRDDDGEIRALHNVCRHRGARLLEDACGSVGNIVCPYHQWTYRPDGTLIHAESQPTDFDRGKFGLKQMHVRTVAGLVFVCFAEEPPGDFAEFASTIEPQLACYRIAETKVAHQTDLVEEGNWKLVMENNRECHHCDAGHADLLSAYFPFHRYDDDDVAPRMRMAYERYREAEAQLTNVCRISNVPTEAHHDLQDRATGFMIMRLPLDGDGISFGLSGGQVCRKLMGDVTEPAFGDLSLHVQPNAWFHFLSDHAVVFRVIPVAPDKSIVRTTWLVHKDAVEGVDYDVDSLTQVWRITNDEDRTLVQLAQRGVEDPAYTPGPYGLIEDDVVAFANWYINRLRAHLSTAVEISGQVRHLSAAAGG